MCRLINEIKIFQCDLTIHGLRADTAKIKEAFEKQVVHEWRRAHIFDRNQCDSWSGRFHQIKMQAFEALFQIYRFGKENPREQPKTDRLIGQILAVAQEVQLAEDNLLRINPNTQKWLNRLVDVGHEQFEVGIRTGRTVIRWRDGNRSDEARWIVRNPGYQSNLARVIHAFDQVPKITLGFAAAMAGILVYYSPRN